MANIFYTKTVTIFNKASGEGIWSEDRWIATVLNNVRLRETAGANIATSGLSDADTAKLHIRFELIDAEYLAPKEWLNRIDKSGTFTLQQGTDFFVVGDVAHEATISADLFTALKEKYDGVYKVTTVDKYDLIPHLEVGGK